MCKVLSILIPSTFDRKEYLKDILFCLYRQIYLLDAGKEVEIITNVDDRTITIGHKRNLLYQMASGEYSVSIDDDDEVSEYYVEKILKAAKLGMDCIGINGIITTNGADEKKWFISRELGYETKVDSFNKEYYVRYPNQITPIKTEITKQFLFHDIRHGEDYEWATRIHQSGLIKTEVIIPEPMYHYKYKNPK